MHRGRESQENLSEMELESVDHVTPETHIPAGLLVMCANKCLYLSQFELGFLLLVAKCTVSTLCDQFLVLSEY